MGNVAGFLCVFFYLLIFFCEWKSIKETVLPDIR
jgi:hypothetical protein